MTVRRLCLVAVLLTGLTLAGCTGAGPGTTSRTGAPALVASSTASATPSATGTAAGVAGPSAAAPNGSKGGDVTGKDLAGIKEQLAAMQREIDSLKMPSDDDFSGAEGAVY